MDNFSSHCYRSLARTQSHHQWWPQRSLGKWAFCLLEKSHALLTQKKGDVDTGQTTTPEAPATWPPFCFTVCPWGQNWKTGPVTSAP